MSDTPTTDFSTITDDRAAAEVFAGLLDMGAPDDAGRSEPDDVIGDNELAEGESPEVDAAQDESLASEETTEQNEQDQDSAIEPPTSWNDAQKAKFKELPSDMQEFVAQRESQRDKVLIERTQQLAEQRKAVEADVAQANHAKTQYAQNLQTLLAMTIPEIKQFDGIDMHRLSQEDQAEWVRLNGVYSSAVQRVNYIQGQLAEVQQHQQQQYQAQYKDYLAQETKILTEHIPEMADPVKFQVIAKDIGSTLSKYGFSDQEIGNVADSRMIRVAARLAELEKREAARVSAQGKKTGAPAPRVIQPNASPTRDSKTRTLNDQLKALQKSGSMNDAANIFASIL